MNNELTATGILSLLSTTKGERGTFIAEVVSKMLNGYASPLEVHVQVKCMEEIVKGIKENPNYKAMVLEAALQHGKGFEFHNAKVDVRSVASRYDYTNDVEWCQLKAALKHREDYLKALPPGGIERVTADGEVVLELPPVVMPGADTVFITLK